ncbi:MAG TPA: heme-binding protein [Gammaproteobacteria bacterium]|nr:heme-binding protein [Gammaproteobacteria bacterium]
MNRRSAVLVTRFAILGALLLSSFGTRAQGVVTLRVLSLPAAKLIAETALAECAARGFHTAVAVVDRYGQLLVLLRDEQATPATIDMARGKAYTALVFRSSTLEFQKATASDPARAAQRDVPGILALGGGVPITVGGEIIGGVASSGSNQTTDDECARAGLAKAADLLK